MPNSLIPPREDVESNAGQGGYGADFSPSDREFQEARMKARAVLEGRGSWTWEELQKIVAKILIGR